jgi:hypothetical protein
MNYEEPFAPGPTQPAAIHPNTPKRVEPIHNTFDRFQDVWLHASHGVCWMIQDKMVQPFWFYHDRVDRIHPTKRKTLLI